MKTKPRNAGFTLIEFVVILTIFSIMAGFSLANYRGFSQNIELSNLAQDIALLTRRAQNYGISAGSGIGDPIAGPSRFGINFVSNNQGQLQSMVLYKKAGGGGVAIGLDGTAQTLETVSLVNTRALVGVCVMQNDICTSTVSGPVPVEFERPNPEPYVAAVNPPVTIRVTAPGYANPWYVVIGAAGNIYVKH